VLGAGRQEGGDDDVSGWHSGFSLAERDVGDHAAVVGLRI
jgi:hypothetical protein